MNVNDFGHVSIVFEYDMMCAHVYLVKCFNFSNIRIRIRICTDFYIKIRIQRMRILINSVTSLVFVVLQDADSCVSRLRWHTAGWITAEYSVQVVQSMYCIES